MSTQDAYIYVIRVDFKDGTADHPVMISKAEPDWDTQLDDAVEFFTQLYKDMGIVSVDYARNIYIAGVNNTETITDWKSYKEQIAGL